MRLLGVLVALVVLIFAAAAARRFVLEAPPADGSAVELTVAAGEPFARVAGRLEDEGLVVSAVRMRLLARLTGQDRAIHAGTYRLERGRPPLALLDDLARGRVLLRRVTVPEGWRAEQIAAVVRDSLGVAPEEFLAAAADEARRARVDARGGTVEGYLYPDTYRFPDGVAAGEVVDAMLARFEEVWRTLPRALPPGLDRHGVVTLASIVEAETPLAAEKPRVAAVYLNRLERGWKLQADPTVRYGLGYWQERLYFKQLAIETPYNTYAHEGLPPGPIGSPGRAALEAVLAPTEPCDDLFFVASGRGGHVFSRTKDEHDRARRAARAEAPG